MERTNGREFAIVNDADIKRIIFRNIAGNPDRFHPDGCIGNFTLVLEDAKAEQLAALGYKVVHKEDRDGDMEARLKVNVRWDNYPPVISRVVEGEKKMVRMNQETVGCLDYDQIVCLDLKLNLSKNQATYLSEAIFVVARNEFADRYEGYEIESDEPVSF